MLDTTDFYRNPTLPALGHFGAVAVGAVDPFRHSAAKCRDAGMHVWIAPSIAPHSETPRAPDRPDTGS
jgi:hypothetical protein